MLFLPLEYCLVLIMIGRIHDIFLQDVKSLHGLLSETSDDSEIVTQLRGIQATIGGASLDSILIQALLLASCFAS